MPTHSPTVPRQVSVQLTIMLVEDNPVNQMLARTLLSRWGHAVQLAENGQQAVDLFPGTHWDLILMDIQMPVMGGLEATRLIRTMETGSRHTPIIAVTANATPADQQACQDAGMDDFLTKPLSTSALKEILTRHGQTTSSCVSRGTTDRPE